MQTSFLFHPIMAPLRPFSGDLSREKVSFHQRKRPTNSVLALRRDAYDKNHQNGRLVDENMIVLRKRIHDIKMVETSENLEELPADWMEWEKRYYYDNYNSDISESMGVLQYLLMETRPSLALGMVALVLFSVPTSMVAVALHLMDMVKTIHLN